MPALASRRPRKAGDRLMIRRQLLLVRHRWMLYSPRARTAPSGTRRDRSHVSHEQLAGYDANARDLPGGHNVMVENPSAVWDWMSI